ncbi:unnamed protein product [Tenebrio molitor]|nr:unnamed protein product [Tenebrio molitor]
MMPRCFKRALIVSNSRVHFWKNCINGGHFLNLFLAWHAV